MDKTFWQGVLRFAVVTAAVIGFLLVVYYVIPLIYPFLVGILFALIFNPVVNFLERKWKFPRWLSVTLSILLLLSLVVTLIVLVVIEIVSEINNLQKTLPAYFEEYIRIIQDFILQDVVLFYDQFTAFYSSLDSEVQRNIEGQVQGFANHVIELGQKTLTATFNGMLALIGSIPTMATAFIISLLASFFISKDWPKLREKFLAITHSRIKHSGGAVLKDLRKALFGFVKAQLTLISITFIIVLIGFLILRIEYALTLALIIGFVDLLPYLGTGLVFVPWIIYLFFTGDYFLVIGLSILYGIVVVQRQIMEPKILGTNVGLDPLLTLVALFVGFQLFGFAGLIIGPVIMVILGALFRAGVFKDVWGFIRGKSEKT